MERATKRTDWANRTEELLKDLGQHLMQPVLPVPDEQTTAIQLIIVPGRLAGLPLHAAPLADARCVADAVGSAVYAPNIAVLSPEKDS